MCKRHAFSVAFVAFSLSVLLGLLVTNVLIAQSEEVDIGVKVGDWAKYGNVSVTWDSEVMEPEPEHVELNNTLWFRNEVSDVKDTVIWFNQTTQFKNDTQKTSTFYMDVYTSDGNDALMFIASGLITNDLMFPGSVVPLRINETVMQMHAGVTREVSHLSLTETQPTEDDPAKLLHLSVNYFWDRETGVLTARNGAGVYTDQAGNQLAAWTRSDEMVDTNLWGPGEKRPSGGFPYALVIVVGAAVVLIGAYVLWPRKRKPGKRKLRRQR